MGRAGDVRPKASSMASTARRDVRQQQGHEPLARERHQPSWPGRARQRVLRRDRDDADADDPDRSQPARQSDRLRQQGLPRPDRIRGKRDPRAQLPLPAGRQHRPRDGRRDARDGRGTGGSIALEILNYKRDGTPFWNAVFIGPVFDQQGKLLYFFASQLDVTRRRNSEQAFRQAQKMEAIGQLTAGLAHDFNNLLQVVNGNLELLGSRVDGDRAKRYIGNARSAAERGAKLTRQLLAFARKTRLEPQADRPQPAGQRIRRRDRKLARRARSISSSTCAAACRGSMVDAEQLEMALLNVAHERARRDAGRRAGHDRRPVRSASNGDSAARHLPEGDYVALEVRDEGTGMTAEVIERATEPFFTTKTQGKGTGLGLAMASGFVQQSRGRLEIESEPGEGATMRFLFPVTREEEDENGERTLMHEVPLAENRSSAGRASAGGRGQRRSARAGGRDPRRGRLPGDDRRKRRRSRLRIFEKADAGHLRPVVHRPRDAGRDQRADAGRQGPRAGRRDRHPADHRLQ